MGGVEVTKSSPVLVKPASEPVTSNGRGIDVVELSSYDKVLVGSVQTALLIFPHPIPSPAETIKRALSQALVHYHPISGRLHASAGEDESGRFIKCTGEGVSFVAATACCTMEDVEFSVGSMVSTALLEDLAVYYDPAEGCRLAADPLLMVQVTEFSDSGFVVGVTWSHAVADGAGMGQFLQAIGELSRGLPRPSVEPVRSDEGLAAVAPSSGAAVAQCFRGVRQIVMAHLDIHVPSRAISRVKHAFVREHGSGCTVFEAVSAMLWQCRARALMADPDAPTALLFSANVRRYAGAKEGYYGNCLAAQLVVATSGAVATGDVVDVVEMIRRAKERIPDQFVNLQGGDDGSSLEEGESSPHGFGYNLFIVTSWRNLGLENADFGGGRPTRVISHKKQKMGMPTCFITGDGMDGSYVLSGCVGDEHASAFLTELARFT